MNGKALVTILKLRDELKWFEEERKLIYATIEEEVSSCEKARIKAKLEAAGIEAWEDGEGSNKEA